MTRTVTKPKKKLSQQAFLLDAMVRLELSRSEFAERIATPERTLGKWLTREDSNDFRNMPGMAWQFISEIVEREGR